MMKQISIGGKFDAAAISLGCMRINELSKKEAEILIRTSMDLGINFFDHADIYGAGKAESFFAEAVEMSPAIRDSMIIQTKCAIRPNVAFDFSKQHIINSVDGSLKRLRTDYVDILLLHRPDTLMEPEEVAEAFEELEKSGKVRYFGVSNQNPGQIALLSKFCKCKILINQLQLSIAHCPMIDSGLNVNIVSEAAAMREGGVLEYCRLHDITIQAWSPFQYGMFKGVFLGNKKYKELTKEVDILAKKYDVSDSAIVVAWILRHPAGIQTIVGTTNKDRLRDIAKAADISLTREEWYRLYMASGKILP